MVRRAGVSTPFWFFVSSETQMFAAGIFPSQVMTGQPGQHRRKRSWWRKTWIVQRCFSGNIRGKKLETWLQCSKHRWRYKECSQQGGNSFWWQFYADFARGNRRTSAIPPNTCSLPFPLLDPILSSNVSSNIFSTWCLDLHALEVLTGWLPVSDVCSPPHACVSCLLLHTSNSRKPIVNVTSVSCLSFWGFAYIISLAIWCGALGVLSF